MDPQVERRPNTENNTLPIVLENGVSGEIYNISAGNEYENIEVVRRILKIMGIGRDMIEFVEDRPGHDLR